jgi:hypothetical protein
MAVNKYSEFQELSILYGPTRKRILDILLEDAKAEKPDISYVSLGKFIRARFPYWAKARVEDFGRSLHSLIMQLPNVEKPKDSKV